MPGTDHGLPTGRRNRSRYEFNCLFRTSLNIHTDVTLSDLAAHCRLLLHNRPKHRRFWRYFALYPLYALCELAIISTDLAELLGSAIGINLLIPSLPLWAAVLLTASDVLIFLVVGDPTRGRGKPVRVFELTVTILVESSAFRYYNHHEIDLTLLYQVFVVFVAFVVCGIGQLTVFERRSSHCNCS